MSQAASIIELTFYSENSSFVLNSIQYNNSTPLKSLYIDQYIPINSSNILNLGLENIFGFLFLSEIPFSSSAVSFFSNLSSSSICQALDEQCENLYFICLPQVNINSYTMFKISLKNLSLSPLNMQKYIKSFVLSRISDLKYKIL